MAYRLSFAGEVADSVRACAAEELATATSLLGEEFEHDPVEAVHEARKSLKKSRALLRLVRPGLPKPTYRRENGTLRDAGRLVSGARDADVMVETVEALAERYAGRIPAADFDGLRDHLRAASLAGRAAAATGDGRVRAVSMLAGVSDRIDDWPLERADWATVAAGMKRAYRAGRQAFAGLGEDPTVEDLHDWRKRVKDLWYHERLIEPAWPEALAGQAEEAHRLSEMLGDDHDLAVLARLLAGADGEPPPVPADPARLVALVGERRAELQDSARHLGSLIYAERPKAFARRIRRVLLEAARVAEAVEAVDGRRV
jgi:CHAD domain-containing protein